MAVPCLTWVQSSGPIGTICASDPFWPDGPFEPGTPWAHLGPGPMEPRQVPGTHWAHLGLGPLVDVGLGSIWVSLLFEIDMC